MNLRMSRMTRKTLNEDLTLVGHLSELRKRIIYMGLSLIIFSLGSYYFAEKIAENIVARAPDMKFIYISPSELMLSYIRIAVFCGFIISLPVIFTQVWLFISPGIGKKEKKYIGVSVAMGSIFFILGSSFAYTLVLPTIMKFFAGFQISEIEATISFASYLNFVISLLLAFGVVFELPIIMFLLTRFRILKSSFFTKYRKYMILIIFIIAAFLTPPDIVSQSLLAIPMMLLYEVGIILSKLGEKRKESQREENESEEDND